ncbi:hypothetical protein KIPB_001948, partial [Kipferlia bialata]|eukprot:g1948.t1
MPLPLSLSAFEHAYDSFISLERIETGNLKDVSCFDPLRVSDNTFLLSKTLYAVEYIEGRPTLVQRGPFPFPESMPRRFREALSIGSCLYCDAPYPLPKGAQYVLHTDTGDWTEIDPPPTLDEDCRTCTLSQFNGKLLRSSRSQEWLLDTETETWEQIPKPKGLFAYNPPFIVGDRILRPYFEIIDEIDGRETQRVLAYRKTVSKGQREGEDDQWRDDEGWSLPEGFVARCPIPIGRGTLYLGYREVKELYDGRGSNRVTRRNGWIDPVSREFIEGPEVGASFVHLAS